MRKVLLFLAFAGALCVSAQEDIDTVNIENEAVRAYMADDTYERDSDFETTVVEGYKDSIYLSDYDCPGGKYVRWEQCASSGDIDSIRIVLSQDSLYSDAVTFYTEYSSQSFTIRNMLPNALYYYKVEELLKSGGVNRVAEGRFRTVGQVRMIQMEGVNNMRDLGGWMTSFGVPVKYGKIFRSANVDEPTASDIHDMVANLGIGAELDLRITAQELGTAESMLGSGVDYYIGVVDSYYIGLRDYHEAFGTNLKWIISELKKGRAVDYHCQIGCDRCGTMSFVIEGLLGLSDIDLGRDYELSTLSPCLQRTRARIVRPLEHIRTFGAEGDDLAQCFYNFFSQNGVTAEEIDYFRSEMLGENYATAVARPVAKSNEGNKVYSIMGIQQSALRRGLNIVVGRDGKVVKKFVK